MKLATIKVSSLMINLNKKQDFVINGKRYVISVDRVRVDGLEKARLG